MHSDISISVLLAIRAGKSGNELRVGTYKGWKWGSVFP